MLREIKTNLILYLFLEYIYAQTHIPLNVFYFRFLRFKISKMNLKAKTATEEMSKRKRQSSSDSSDSSSDEKVTKPQVLKTGSNGVKPAAKITKKAASSSSESTSSSEEEKKTANKRATVKATPEPPKKLVKKQSSSSSDSDSATEDERPVKTVPAKTTKEVIIK